MSDSNSMLEDLCDLAGVSPSQSEQNSPPHNNVSDSTEPLRYTQQELDWMTLPDILRQYTDRINTNTFGREFLRIPSHKIVEMDAFSKCWKSVPSDSHNLLLNEADGGVWAFCQGCVANIPRDLQEILYFFHMLQSHITNLSHYAVPSKNVVLRFVARVCNSFQFLKFIHF